jgi:hypothetical protein
MTADTSKSPHIMINTIWTTVSSIIFGLELPHKNKLFKIMLCFNLERAIYKLQNIINLYNMKISASNLSNCIQMKRIYNHKII